MLTDAVVVIKIVILSRPSILNIFPWQHVALSVVENHLAL